MLKYFISICIILLGINSFSQEKPKNPKTKKEVKSTIKKDTTTYKSPYGIRLGIDISKPILGFADDTYSGLELVGDYRITKNWYVATELGYEEKFTEEDFTQSTSKGSYIRLGANLNLYKNWLDMNNEIYFGARYGFAVFEQILHQYTPNVTDSNFPSYFGQPETVIANALENGLTIHWLEFQLGTKVETIKNLFIGFNISFKVGLAVKRQNNFDTLYAPGFNRVFAGRTGFGFNYSISYLIPFKKK